LDQILKIIVERLEEKEIDPGKIPSCVETIVYNIFLNPVITYQELNRKMQSLGWHNFEIDEHTLKLIKLIPCRSKTAPAH
jgi:hypothetical protein